MALLVLTDGFEDSIMEAAQTRIPTWDCTMNRSPSSAVALAGSCRFVLGFGIPLAWLYASYLYFSAHQENDPRERPGLAACAVAGMVATTAGIFTGIVLFLESF